MTALAANDFERRIYPRIAINGQVRYRLEDETEFTDGVMINLSQTGVLISLQRELAIHSRLILRMEPDSTDQPPIEIIAEIVRTAETDQQDTCCYGCMILDVQDL